LIFTVGQYCMVSMALNSFGVQIEDETERFPAHLFADGTFTTSAAAESPINRGE